MGRVNQREKERGPKNAFESRVADVAYTNVAKAKYHTIPPFAFVSSLTPWKKIKP